MLDDSIAQGFLQGRILYAQQHLGVAHAYQAHLQVVLNLGGQFQEPELVGNGRAFFAHAVCHLLLREAAFLHEALITHGHLNGIQVFPLDIFHNGHFQHALFRGVTNVCGNHVHAGHDGSTVATFAADNLVLAVSLAAHGDGLDKAESTDGVGQFPQGLVVKIHTGLVRVGLYQVHGDTQHV